MPKPTRIWPSNLSFLPNRLFRCIPGNSIQSNLAASLSSVNGVSSKPPTATMLQDTQLLHRCNLRNVQVGRALRHSPGTSSKKVFRAGSQLLVQPGFQYLQRQGLYNLVQGLTTPYTELGFPVFQCVSVALLLCVLKKRTLSSLYLPVRKWFTAVGITDLNFIITVHLLKI